MTSPAKANEPEQGRFASPSALRQYAIQTAAHLRRAGLSEAGNIMESAANFAATTGSEWLGELGQAAKTIHRRFDLPQVLAVRVARIAEAARSRHPYG